MTPTSPLSAHRAHHATDPQPPTMSLKLISELTISDIKNEAAKLGLDLTSSRDLKPALLARFREHLSTVSPHVSLDEEQFEVDIAFDPDLHGHLQPVGSHEVKSRGKGARDKKTNAEKGKQKGKHKSNKGVISVDQSESNSSESSVSSESSHSKHGANSEKGKKKSKGKKSKKGNKGVKFVDHSESNSSEASVSSESSHSKHGANSRKGKKKSKGKKSKKGKKVVPSSSSDSSSEEDVGKNRPPYQGPPSDSHHYGSFRHEMTNSMSGARSNYVHPPSGVPMSGRQGPGTHQNMGHNPAHYSGPMYHGQYYPPYPYMDATPYPYWYPQHDQGKSHKPKRRDQNSVPDKKACKDPHCQDPACSRQDYYRENEGNPGIFHSPNMRFCGASIPPLRTADPLTDNGVKRKLLSGRHSTINQEVRKQEAWPHTCLDKALVGEFPEYADMTPYQFFAGMTGKILCEIDPLIIGSATENKLKHLNRVASYACNTGRESMLNFNAQVLDAIEQGQLSWSNWDSIQSLHNKHLDSIRLKVGIPGADRDGAPDKSKPKDSTFVPQEYMRSKGICFRFQNGACDNEGSHTIENGSTVLHICGLCHMLRSENISEHGYKLCPSKKKSGF